MALSACGKGTKLELTLKNMSIGDDTIPLSASSVGWIVCMLPRRYYGWKVKQDIDPYDLMQMRKYLTKQLGAYLQTK